MKAWCIWCDSPKSLPKNGFLWIHQECFSSQLGTARHLGRYIEEHPDALPEEIIQLYDRLVEVDEKMRKAIKLMREAY